MKSLKQAALVLLVIISAISVQCCKSSKSTQVQASDLENKWVLKTMNGQSASELFRLRVPTLEFNQNEMRVSGTSGCNRFSGAYTLTKNNFSAPMLVGTMMACPDMENETTFRNHLSQTSKLSINKEGDLVFTQSGKTVLVFEKQRPLTAAELSGEWQLDVLQGATANVYFKDKYPTINFDFKKKQVFGNAGCNHYFGSFAMKGLDVEIGTLATSRMLCPNVMEGENKFVTVLAGTSTLELDNGRLVLSRDGVHVATFSKK